VGKAGWLAVRPRAHTGGFAIYDVVVVVRFRKTKWTVSILDVIDLFSLLLLLLLSLVAAVFLHILIYIYICRWTMICSEPWKWKNKSAG
jgi:uncharacterized membrane protein